MASVPVRDALVSSSNCHSWSGSTRTGSMVIASFRASTAVVHSFVHTKGWSFFVKSCNGLAILAKSLMKARWYPTTPRNLRTSRTVLSSVGRSRIPEILLGSIDSSPFLTWKPRKSTSGCSNMHFSGQRNKELSAHI